MKHTRKEKTALLKCDTYVDPRVKSKNDRIWWEKQFKELERIAATPDFKKYKNLQNTFSEEELCKLEENGVEIIRDADSIISDETHENYLIESRRKSNYLKPKREGVDKGDKFTNVFMEYMKLSKEEIRARMTDGHVISKTMENRSEEVLRRIARKFMKKFSAIHKDSVLSEKLICQIFEIKCSLPISNCFTIQSEWLASVAEGTANYLGCHDRSHHQKLLQVVLEDVKVIDSPVNDVAFGRVLPVELRSKPCTDNPSAKWVIKDTEHEDVVDFAYVWRDITDLETTRGYCGYLLAHPEVTPPAYLRKQGMLLKSLLNRPAFLGELETNLEALSTARSMNISSVAHIIQHTRHMRAKSRPRVQDVRSMSSRATHKSCGDTSDVNFLI